MSTAERCRLGRRPVRHCLLLAVAALACLAACICLCTAQAQAADSAQRLTDYGDLSNLNASDGCAVWEDGSWNDDRADVFAWTSGNGVRNLTGNGLNAEIDSLALANGRAAWSQAVDRSGGRLNDDCYQVYTWTPAGGVLRLTSERWDSSAAEVSGDRVVWHALAGPEYSSEIFTWTPQGGVVRLTDNATDDYCPVVSGDRVAWMGATQVMVWTAADGATPIGPTYTRRPEELVISGDRVAWAVRIKGRIYDRTLYTWSPASGLVTLRTQASSMEAIKLDGDRLMWAERNHGLYTWTPRGGIVTVWPQIMKGDADLSGDRVLWGWDLTRDGRTDMRSLYSWTPSTGAEVLLRRPEKADIHDVRLAGRRMFWTESQGGRDSALFTGSIPRVSALRVTAFRHAAVRRGGRVALACKVACARPWFKPLVVLTMRNQHGKVVKQVNLGRQPFGRRLSWAFVCNLPAGRYTWSACVQDAATSSHASLAISAASVLVVKR